MVYFVKKIMRRVQNGSDIKIPYKKTPEMLVVQALPGNWWW